MLGINYVIVLRHRTSGRRITTERLNYTGVNLTATCEIMQLCKPCGECDPLLELRGAAGNLEEILNAAAIEKLTRELKTLAYEAGIAVT